MFTTYDWSHTVQSAEVEVPAGESIVKFPFAAMTKTDSTEFHHVQFLIMDADTPTGTLYFDAVGCYFPDAGGDEPEVMDPTKRTHAADTFIWDDMDYADIARAKQEWTTITIIKTERAASAASRAIQRTCTAAAARRSK